MTLNYAHRSYGASFHTCRILKENCTHWISVYQIVSARLSQVHTFCKILAHDCKFCDVSQHVAHAKSILYHIGLGKERNIFHTPQACGFQETLVTFVRCIDVDNRI